MRSVIESVFDGSQESDLLPEDWTFEPPFRPLVHRWEQLNELQAQIRGSDEDDIVDEKQATDDLMSFLEPILAPSVHSLARTRDTGKISYNNIWQIFQPSELIITTTRGVPSLGRVTKYKEKELGWRIHLEKLAWDGSRCGYVQQVAWIGRFSGDRYVNSFNVYPVSFHKDPEGFKSSMLQRGRKFERLRGYHAQTYKGSMCLADDKPNTGGRPVSSPCCYCSGQ